MCRCDPGSVRASTKHQSARWASEVQTFCPSTCQPSSRRTALVRTPARSDAGARLGVALAPQLGAGQDARAGSGPSAPWVPKAASVGPASCSPMCPMRAGPPARAYSSWKTTCCAVGRAAAAGLDRPADADPAGLRRARAPTPDAARRARARGPGPPLPTSGAKRPVRCSASQPRTSSRNCSTPTVDRSVPVMRRTARPAPGPPPAACGRRRRPRSVCQRSAACPRADRAASRPAATGCPPRPRRRGR